jgi:hypothetical protein
MCPSGGSRAGDGVGAAAGLPAVSSDVAAVGFCKDSLEETAELSHPSSCRRFLLLATTEGRSLARVVAAFVLRCLGGGLTASVAAVAAAAAFTAAGADTVVVPFSDAAATESLKAGRGTVGFSAAVAAAVA